MVNRREQSLSTNHIRKSHSKSSCEHHAVCCKQQDPLIIRRSLDLLIMLLFVTTSLIMPLVNGASCNLNDPKHHVCLHIYLERDFPLLHQMIINPAFIKEGREFEEVCGYVYSVSWCTTIEHSLIMSINRKIKEMGHCYHEMLDDCGVYFDIESRAQILRVITSIESIHRFLCSNRSIALEGLY